jgi:hypothetical protein
MSDNPGDNPKDRFIAFFLGFGGFILFGGVLLMVGLIASPRSLPDPAGDARFAHRQDVDRAQGDRLDQLGLGDFLAAAEERAGKLALREVRPSAVPVPGTAAAAALLEASVEGGDPDGDEDGGGIEEG